MSKKVTALNKSLFSEIKQVIEESRQLVAQAVNAGLTAMYWNIGKCINDDILKNKRADYGKQIVASLAQQLTEEYGKGWSAKHLQHCLRFAETFPDFQIVSALWRQFNEAFPNCRITDTTIELDSFYCINSLKNRHRTRLLHSDVPYRKMECSHFTKKNR